MAGRERSDSPRRIRMRLERRPSELLLGAGAVAGLPGLIGDGPAAVVLDNAVPHLHRGRLVGALRDAAGHPLPTRTLVGGEGVKQIGELDHVLRWLADVGLPRDGALVGVGGGALLDLAGLAAALWARGVRFVAVPTTLLAQCDAAIGGKTAINVGGLKNPAGAFHPASHVVADPDFLATLPRREWRSGLAELIKTAVIGAPRLFAALERRAPALARALGDGDAYEPPAGLDGLPWADWIARAARVKARLVSADFREAGPRQALNLGHTLGHALELSQGLSHGEAVAAGMAAAARLAVARGLCPAGEAGRIAALLQACGLPTAVAPPPRAQAERLLAHDKKRRDGAPGWVLPERIGAVRIGQAVELDEALRALQEA